MEHKILLRWLSLIFAPFVITISLYKVFIGPTPPYVSLAVPVVFLMIVPVSYLSYDWKYIQTTRFGGSFGDANAPVKSIVSIPGGVYNDIDISRFDHYRAHLGRWSIFTKADQPFTIFYDRFTKKWYYHLKNIALIFIPFSDLIKK